MADFMSVLAASPHKASGAAQGKVLAGLSAAGLFVEVLSERIGVAEAASAPGLPPALADAFGLDAKPAARKPPLATDLATEQAAEQAAEPAPTPLAMPMVLAEGGGKERHVAPSRDTPETEVPARVERGPMAKQAAEMAATPAALTFAPRQELPMPHQASALAGAVSVGAAEAPGEVLAPLPAVGATLEPGKPLDASVAAATRQLGQFEHLARSGETPLRAALEAPVRSQGFPAELSDKIVWLSGRQAQVAELSLNPPQLGALEVRLSVSGSEAGAQFYSPHPQVREAIESALPKLRELLAQAGIALGDAQVRDEAFARGEPGAFARGAGGSNPSGEASASPAMAAGGVVRAGLGLVDLYA